MSGDAYGSIIGRWRLVATSATDEGGAPVEPPYGAMPLGYVEFFPDGRMMAVLTEGGPTPPSGRSREFNAYSGACSFDRHLLVTEVDGSSNPEWIGGQQVRRAHFEGEHLVLEPPPRAVRGVVQHRRLVWERAG